MQILLGVHETIIKINSNTISIEYIQNFINTHFQSRKIQDNTIIIPSSDKDIHSRAFLLKWLYSLYTKKHGSLPKLKESLLHRQHKAIKIITKKKIFHTLCYKVINKHTINVTIRPSSDSIIYALKTFLQTKIVIMPHYLRITLSSQEDKNLLKTFINTNTIINIPHKHIYNQEDLTRFFLCQKQEKIITAIQSAYLVLGVSPLDDAKTIKNHYKSLAKKYHPDSVYLEHEDVISDYTKKFQVILEAYEVLSK
ncbi:J domain-containing protein [Sulfurimonas sp. SAG-AH-194-I05]|nr:J domain-containing protein [Sulfurimonas sp. SAG-AH-194-I05]MDF1874206.1 J domain-containing protein [Sulfurimonas sp. SAG-AH-194-I05]